MAAGTTIQLKRKAGSFVGGNLAAGEFGVDTTNSVVYFSVDGATVVAITNHAAATLGASVTDVLSLSGQAISAVDAGADKLVFWDDSAGELTYATIGGGLEMVGAELRASELLQIVVQRHDPSAAQSGTTTYADLDGSSISFTPVSASSKILYRYTFYQANVSGSGLGSFKLLLDGSEQTESKFSIFDSTSAIGEGYRTYEYLIDSWGTTAKTLKVQGREYSAGNEVKWHETVYADGAASSVLVRAVLTITEIL